MFNHPEISKYGLELNYDLWREFNKEKKIRKMIRNQAINYFGIKDYDLDSFFKVADNETIAIYDAEHKMLSDDLETLVRKKRLDYYTFESIENKKRLEKDNLIATIYLFTLGALLIIGGIIL